MAKHRPDNIAIDSDGHVLPYDSREVRAITDKALHEGNVLAVIMEMPDGNIAVQVMGPPSSRVLEALEITARSYRKALKGH
jgi:hypothetical protein